jgi:hypothetical protein
MDNIEIILLLLFSRISIKFSVKPQITVSIWVQNCRCDKVPASTQTFALRAIEEAQQQCPKPTLCSISSPAELAVPALWLPVYNNDNSLDIAFELHESFTNMQIFRPSIWHHQGQASNHAETAARTEAIGIHIFYANFTNFKKHANFSAVHQRARLVFPRHLHFCMQISPKQICFSARQTVQKEGFFALYKGMAAPLVGVSPLFAVFFGGTAVGKWLQQKEPNQKLTFLQNFNAGLLHLQITMILVHIFSHCFPRRDCRRFYHDCHGSRLP